MANITSRVSRGIHPNLRTQVWNTASGLNDAGNRIDNGDIFLVKESLGHPAKNATFIVASSGINVRVRFNNRVTTYLPRPKGEYGYSGDYYDLLASGLSYTDSGVGSFTMAADSTWVFNDEFPIETVEIVDLDSTSFILIVS